MKHTAKKMLSFVIALALLVSLCSVFALADDPAPIKIGFIGPLTGAAAVYGVATDNGAQIAVDEINEAAGYTVFEYNPQDDENDAEKAVNAYAQLKDWGMQILYGTTTTAPCVAVAAETNADRYFELTPSASSTDVTAGKDNVFQMCFTDPNQGITAANYIKENALGEKIAIIYNSADAYSTGIAQAFVAQAAEIELEVVEQQAFLSDTDADFSVQINACKDAGADLVFLPIYYTPASMILRQSNELGYEPKWFGADGMDGILAVEGFDASLAEGVMLMTPFNAASETGVAFVEKYEEAYGETPNQFAADGYDCIYAIYAACQKAGITAETSHEDACEALIAAFTSEDFAVDGLTGTGMTWGTNGEVAKAPIVAVIEDGAYVIM